jgi:rhodanese-related sulfurtransferase
MRGREFKDAAFQHFAKMAHAFSAPKRLEIIDVLGQGERDVETLAREARASVANTSRHLQVLRQARLVETRKEGVRVVYRLADIAVLRCWKHLQALAESQLPEVRDAVRRYFEERDGMVPISREELQRRIRRDQVVVLDVRPVEEYRAGHIPGAVSVPLSELKGRLEEIPLDHEIVAYCRGPYCVLSAEAVALLRTTGRRAVRLVDGLPEWRDAGLEVDVGRPSE